MRRSFTLFSVVAHAIAISVLLIAQVFAVGTLPTPHRPVIFENIRLVKVADIESPAPPKPRVARTNESGPAVSLNAAPVVAPASVAPETGHEGRPSSNGPMIPMDSGPDGLTGSVFGHGAPVEPPPPPPRPAVPMRVHVGVAPPAKVVDVAPLYPVVARTAHVEGVVILEAVIDAQGRVESARVLRSIPLLDSAALDAVRQWRFTPARLNNEAVPVVMTVTVNFTLRDR